MEQQAAPAKPCLAVVIPCYKVKAHVLGVIGAIGPEVDLIFCVDDACPEGSGAFIRGNCNDPRVQVVTNPVNKGVGGAVMAGYQAAAAAGAQVIVKVDGDGQMDPRLIPRFVAPILSGAADYAKGNRFHNLSDVKRMPGIRIFGNAVLSFLTKISSGYWNVFDPTNGYTAIHATMLGQMPLGQVEERYFFESDLLHHLYLANAVVVDIPMQSVYANEESNLHIRRIIVPFLVKNIRNTVRRLLYAYFLRDFSVASLEMLIGVPLVLFGLVFGINEWTVSLRTGMTASAGTVMTAAFPIIIGVQLLLASMGHDIASVPRTPVHPLLEARRRQLLPPHGT